MEELLGRVKQGFWTFTGLNFKWKHEHKQWEHHFARGGNSLAKWPISQGEFHLAKILQGDFPHGAKFCHFAPWRNTLRKFRKEDLDTLRNAFEIPCFKTLLMIFHCRFSKIFCLTFSFVNTYFTLVINQWKGCFCNSSCNLACYCL